MPTNMITVKFEEKFLEEVDNLVKNEGYQSRTEFIRSALREKIEEIKIKKAMLELAHLKGCSNKVISKEQYEKARTKIFEEISKRIK